ncbi:hypothetical protein [Sulfurihydrogenibium sp.]|uniref:hypothetical protein n=1 Tax=Sulfurihydrogenibium sp. TaxID=2053621 RepID=UPI002620F05A|nr:hypothetical protein [Sulfurihydrogenibium sp.]
MAEGELKSMDLLMRKTLINKKTKKYTFFESKYENFAISWRDCFKNPHCHSERREEPHVFLFKSKNQKRDLSTFDLRMTRKDKLTKILEQPHILDEKFRLFIFIFTKKF